MREQTKKLFRYTIPSILGMMSVFIFSIIDGIFLGNGVGINAVGAINLAFPFVMVFSAVTMLTTIGGLTITAIRMGRKDYEGANRIFMLSFSLSACTGLLICTAGIFCTEFIARLLGATDTFLELVKEYIFWYSVFIVPCCLCITLNGFARNDGAPVLVSVLTIIATSLNVLGDYIFIFPLHMGLKGAAIATGISQTIAFCGVLCHFLFRRGRLHFGRAEWNPRLVLNIFKRGTPECAAQFSTPITMVCTNIVLAKYLGDVAINAYSLIMFIATFSASIFIGASQGLQPLFGNSYGSSSESDLKFYLKSGLALSFFSCLVVNTIIFFIGAFICSLFNADAASAALCEEQMTKYLIALAIESITVTISDFFYSTTRTKESLITYSARGFTVNILAVLLLPAIFGADSIWYAHLVTEIIVMSIALILLRHSTKDGFIRNAQE